jgi:hypothetical protein
VIVSGELALTHNTGVRVDGILEASGSAARSTVLVVVENMADFVL